MSRLRARCPDCRTLTAVSLGGEYQCHSCGREFGAGLVRVPRAWGVGGEPMAEAAWLPLPWPEAGVIDEESPEAQAERLAAELPDRPLVLGGCCCAHVGAVQRLAARRGRVGVVWLDQHGDLNTPATSLSGNRWGMPLRELIDAGSVSAQDVALVGAWDLDSPEQDFVRESGLHTGPTGVARALEGTVGVYVALDCDVLDPAAIVSHMPSSRGLALADVESLLARIAASADVLGAGLSGLVPDERNVESLSRLLRALGL